MQNLQPGQVDSQVTFAPSGGRFTGQCNGNVEETWSGVTYYSPANCSGSYQTYSSRVGSRPGFRFDSFFMFRALINSRQMSVMSSGGNCPNSSQTYNYLLLRGKNKNDYVEAMDYSSTSTWAGGSFTYDGNASPALTGQSRFSLQDLTNLNQTAFSYATRGDACASASWNSKASSAGNAPLGEFTSWLFGNSVAVSISDGSNPIMTVAVPQVALSTESSFWQGKNKNVYSGLMTSFTGRGEQRQRSAFLTSDSTGKVFSVSFVDDEIVVNSSNVGPSSVTLGNLNDITPRQSGGTLSCSNLNSPTVGFCSGTLSFVSNPTAIGKAACLFSFGNQGKDLMFCAAQKPDDNSQLITFMGGTSSISRLEVTVNPLHLSAGQASGVMNVTVRNLTSRPVANINPDSLTLAERLQTPFTPILNNSLTGALGAGGFISGNTCGRYLPAFSSCTVQVTYAPTTQRADRQTFRLPYDRSQDSTMNATAPLLGSRGLSSISITANDFTVGSNSQATVTATFANGTTQNITSLVTIESSAPQNMTVSSAGVLEAPAAGSATLTARFDSFSGTDTVQAHDQAPNLASIAAEVISSSQIDLSWVSGGGNTTAYQVAYQAGATAPANCSAGTVVSAAIYSVTGLSPNTEYSFRVCATNPVGTLTSGLIASATTYALPFISTWKTDNAGASASNQITLPLESTGTYNFNINWGDGTSNTITTWDDANTTHTYASAGTYTVTIHGTITGFRFNNGGDRRKLTNISQFGSLRLGNNNGYFFGATNLTITATDTMDLTGTTDLTSAFENCTSLTTAPSMASWNTSAVTNMSRTFFGTFLFNQNIGSWNTSAVTDMRNMFHNARAFNQNIGSWNTVNVTRIDYMFCRADKFNQPIGNWNTGKIWNVEGLFNSAYEFNQPLANWNTSAITNMAGMFYVAYTFNQNIGSWNTANVTNMAGVFEASGFNQNIGGWNTSKVTNMARMFHGNSFNQNIGSWNVTSLTNATDMFGGWSHWSRANYDALLLGWSAQNVKTGVVFNAYTTKYSGSSAVTAARSTLTTAVGSGGKGWTITDGGVAVIVPGAPTSVAGTAGNAEVSLAWVAPSSDGGNPIADYVIQSSSDNGTNWTTFNDGTSAAVSATITGLANGTSYVFRVAAVNSEGTGSYSTASASVTPRTTPGAPTSVAGTPGVTQVPLTWVAPVSNGGSAITDYVVEYQEQAYQTETYTLTRSSSNYWTTCSPDNGTGSLYDGNLGNGIATGNGAQTIQADLGSAKTIARVRLNPLLLSCTWSTNYLNGTNLQYSTDGTNWTTFTAISGTAEGSYKDYFPDVTARYWRIQSTGFVGLGEFVLETNTGSWVTFNDGISNAASATVTGLASGKSYIFRVSAVNAAGAGLASSNSASVTTITTPAAPTNLAGTAGNTQVALTWAAPSNNGGSAITDYIVQYSSNNGTSWTTFNDGTSTSTSATVTGLLNGTSYIFQVAAVNTAGTGNYSSSSGSLNPGIPGAPTSVAGTPGNTQVALTWAAPASSGASAISDYVIQYSSNGSSWTTFNDGASTALSATVTGLVNATGYIFRVAAVNTSGQGLYSSNSASITPRTVPSAPTGVTGSGAGSTQISVSWTAPSNNGSAITDYVIQYSSNSGTSWTTFTDGTSSDASALVTGLVGGTSYIFRVAAVNAAGTGSYSANSTGVTPQLLTCSSDCYLEGTAPNYAQAFAVGTERVGPNSTTLTLTSGASGFKVWTEKGGTRILNAAGTLAGGWQKQLNRAGTGFTETNLTAVSNIAGRVCPTHVFLDYSNMTATSRCVYFDGATTQALDSAGTSLTEGQDWIQQWNRANSGRGTASSYYEGNVKTCADKGMRMPTMYETKMTKPTSDLPTGDTGVNPTWAGSTNGVPVTGSASSDYTFTASAYTWSASSYHVWGGDGTTAWSIAYNDNRYKVRCVLPNSITSPPGAPTSVSGVAGINSVALSWAAPASLNGSAVINYVIQYSSNSGTSWTTASDPNSAATSFSVTGLVAGTSYIFRVAAVNADGTGTYSSNSASVTPDPAPTITSVSPTAGVPAGGGTLTINGTGFLSGLTVTVGGAACTSPTRVSATQATCTLPSGTPGAKNVVLTNSDTQSGTLANGYTYYRATGGTITEYTSGGVNYVVHTFSNNPNNQWNTFQLSVDSLSVDYLIVGGGGGGGSQLIAGGGGGGGVLNGTTTITTTTNYIWIGAGGSGAISTVVGMGNPGQESIALGLTAYGGGGGGSSSPSAGASGATIGSAGGGGAASASRGLGGSTSSGQGNNGGNGRLNTTASLRGGGGGGGAGGAGASSPSNGAGGAGGAGFGSTLRDGTTTVYYGAGGGGGGPTTGGPGGSSGAGGKGGQNGAGSSAEANTGGGGGGAGRTTAVAGGAGGSGIVIIRYVK